MWNETSRRMGPPYAAFVVIIECGMLLMVPIGGMFFLKGSLTASALLLFVYVGSMYLTEIRPLQELGTNFANVLNAITKTKEILDIPIYEGGTDFPQKHDIELRNVRFSYDGKTDVLHGVNLKIHDGERMALVGRSGAGKSTVIELISRFYDVQEGEVLIGGKNVKELDYDTILKNIAIVFQKTFLTRDSVLENIRMGSNATLEEVRAAAKEAQIDDFIMSLPDGYETKVGSFGSRFSGGEKQRIAIARAIPGEHRAPSGSEGRGSQEGRHRDAGQGRHPRPGAPLRAVSARVLRRYASACRHRHRCRLPSADPHLRRAHHRSGRDHSGTDPAAHP